MEERGGGEKLGRQEDGGKDTLENGAVEVGDGVLFSND